MKARLLAADPANWAPARPDVRPLMRREIERMPPGPVRHFAAWFTDRLNADGTLPVRADRHWLARKWGCSLRTLSRHLAAMEAAGLIERRHAGRLVARTGLYRHVSVITAAARFGQVSNVKPMPVRNRPLTSERDSTVPPTPHKSVTVGLHGLRSSDHVQDVTRVRDLGAQPRDLVDEDQRAADRALRAAHWPRLARSRSDLPDARPSAVRFTAPPCPRCTGRHSPLGLCPDQAAATLAAEGRF